MSVNDYVEELQAFALTVTMKSGAITGCQFHPEVAIRVGDPDAERRAYAIAINFS